MESIVVRWQTKTNWLMNIVQVTGVPKDSKQTQNISRVLLKVVLDIVMLAEMYNGRLLASEPPKGNVEFVYFEVIFKSNTDVKSFLEAMRNKSSE